MHDIERQALGDIARSLQILANGGDLPKGDAITGGGLNLASQQREDRLTAGQAKPLSEIERELNRMERALSELSAVASSLWERANLVVLPPAPSTTGGCDAAIETAQSPAGSAIQSFALRADAIAAQLRNFRDSLAT